MLATKETKQNIANQVELASIKIVLESLTITVLNFQASCFCSHLKRQ
jgi:hypothetical protein